MHRIALLGILISLKTFAADLEVIEAASPSEDETVKTKACRPTVACTAELVPAGFFEVEAGYGGRMGGQGLQHSAQVLLKYSALDTLQVQLAFNNLVLGGSGVALRSFDGVMPGVKWLINPQGTWLPANALSVHLMIPNLGFAEAVQKTFDLQAWWYVTKDLGFFHVDVNVALAVFDLGHAPTPQGLTSLSMGFDLTHGFALFTELYSTWGNAQAMPLDGGSLSGLNYSPIEEISFDVGADVGFYRATRAFTVFAGVTFVPHGKRRLPLARVVTPAGALARNP